MHTGAGPEGWRTGLVTLSHPKILATQALEQKSPVPGQQDCRAEVTCVREGTVTEKD